MRSVVNWSIHFFESLLLQRIEIELVFSVLRPRSAPPPELLLLRIMGFMGVQCRKELGSIPIAPLCCGFPSFWETGITRGIEEGVCV